MTSLSLPNLLRQRPQALKRWRSFLLFAVCAAATWCGSQASAQVAGAIAVYPGNSTLEIGSTLQMTAYVPISPNTVTWLVNDIPGGDGTVGTISPTGLYTPPTVIPAANVLTVKVRSTAYPSAIGSTTLKITRKYPWLWSASPAKLQTGNYSVTFNGASFAPDSVATANGVDIQTTYFSPTKLVVTGPAPAPGTINFAVRQPGPGAVTGNSVAVPVTATVVTVAVSPTTASVALGASKAFSATVTGNANTAVTWSVNGTPGGSATVGTITSGGVYTAPAAMPSPATVTVQAISVASPSSTAQATVTLTLPPPPVTVAVAPATATVQVGSSQSFTATVTGSANTTVTWAVNGINGGSAAVGTITSGGVYVSPASLPANPTIMVRATSAANPASFAQATVTLTPPPPPVSVTVAPATASVQLGTSKTFTATVLNAANTAVTWSVNGTAGGSPLVGLIDVTGNYTAPAAPPASSTVTIRATSVASPSTFAQATVTLTAPPLPPVWLSGARFLEQSSFGPSPVTLAKIQQMGIDAYLQEQFTLPETQIPAFPDNYMGSVQQWVLYNYTSAPDQLRQRVAYSLSQIIVTSSAKLIYANEITPWMRLLSQHAFGNYRNLLHDISISPSMGKYLDLANSMKPGLAGGANENYARELMQLFTIGLYQLNQDGSQVIDPVTQLPVPTYDQQTVAQVALALTGWTFATPPGGNNTLANWENFSGPMEPRQQFHDTSAKSILGKTLPAGQTVQQDLDGLIDILMTHPNMAPFIATRLIRSLVTSNPSAAYIKRVADVFVDNGAGVRGDLKAVVTAVLMDDEARQDVPTLNSGRLKEPILQISGLLRALNGGFNQNEGLTYLYGYMSQTPLGPNSVFSWYSPLYHVPNSPLFGPEFQIYSPTEATLRGNFFFSILNYPAGDMYVDLTPFQPYGNDMPGLVEAVNQTLLYGRMDPVMKQILIDAATPGYDAKTRIETVLYLTALSGQYAVQH